MEVFINAQTLAIGGICWKQAAVLIHSTVQEL
jgi:hypothetical protein